MTKFEFPDNLIGHIITNEGVLVDPEDRRHVGLG